MNSLSASRTFRHRHFLLSSWLAVSLGFLLSMAGTSAWAAPTLKKSDLVVVDFQQDDTDGFKVLVLAPIPASSVVFFTDAQWLADGNLSANQLGNSEWQFKWTSPSSVVAAGTIITFTVPGASPTASVGTINTVYTSVGGGLSIAGDQLVIYQTDDDSASLLSSKIQRLNSGGSAEAGPIYSFNADNAATNNAWSTQVNGWGTVPNSGSPTPGVSTAGSHTPPNSVVFDNSGDVNRAAANAFGLGTFDVVNVATGLGARDLDNLRYNGPVTAADKAGWLIRIHNPDNWIGREDVPWDSGQGTLSDVSSTPVGSVVVPTVTTATQSGVTHDSATLGGNVTADGGATVSERGIVWGTSADPTTSNNKVQIGTGTGAFSQLVTGLPSSTTVHVRAYAINTAGTAYGDNISFATSAAPAPQIAVSFGGNAVEDNAVTTSSANGTDFGSAPVAGVTVDRTFTITNNGTAGLTLGTVTTTGDFSVQSQPAGSVAASGGTTSFTIRFDPDAAGPRAGTVSFSTNEAGKNPFNFAVQGTGTGPQTFDLAGNAINNTPFDGGETYIFVTNVAPTDITLTPSSIAENNAANAVVGTLDAVDADLADTHVFELVSGTGAEDNDSFEIDGTSLKILVSADFETKSSYSIRVRATDSGAGNLQFTKPLTVTITNVNEVPSFVKGADQLHTAATGAQSVSGWATAIDDGDSTVVQTVSFEITGNNNPGLFSTGPAVAADGTLSYTLSGTLGTATITLRIVDDTSIGGQPAQASATQNFSITNQAAPNYAVTYAGGHLTCTDMSGNGDAFYLLEHTGEAGSVRFFANGRTFSVNGGLNTTTQTAPFATADLNSVTINAGAGNDTIRIQSNIPDSILSLPSLTINGGTGDDSVIFLTHITFKPNASLEADLQDDDATPGTDSITIETGRQLLLSGTGAVDLKCSRNLHFGASSVLQTENGAILVEGNQQATPSTGSFDGLMLFNAARVEATGTGGVTLRARSGTSTSAGMLIHSGSKVLAGMGGILLHGRGQDGHTSSSNHGVNITGAGSQVSAAGGSVHITGIGGGSGGSSSNMGIVVQNLAEVSATGAGDINLIGTGGNTTGTGGNNFGVMITGDAPVLSTETGTLSIDGVAGGGAGSSNNHGVYLNTGSIGTDGGEFYATGHGSAAGAGHGVLIYRTIQTQGGEMDISGYGGAQGGLGIYLDSGDNLESGGGDISLYGVAGGAPGATRGVDQRGSLLAAGGTISVTGLGTGAGTGLEGIYSSAPVTTSGTGTISMHGTASPAGGGQGVLITGSSEVTTGGGGISITGIGGGGVFGTSSYGVFVDNRPVSGPGAGRTLTIHGTGGAGAVTHAAGVLIGGSSAQVQTSGGDVSMTGIGGAAASTTVAGVYLHSNALVRAGGDGDLTLHGTGGGTSASSASQGIYVSGAVAEVAGAGDITLTGIGGSGVGDGVLITHSLVTDGGDITLTGTGAAAGGRGIQASAMIEAAGTTGGITLTGTGGAAAGGDRHGVNLTHNVITNNGPITITGTAGGQDGALTSRGIFKSTGSITVGGDHDLTLVADSMTLGGNNTINAAGNDVLIRQKTVGTGITLGGNDTVTGSPLVLGLSDAELDCFVADEVRVGNADTGAMTVAGVISPLSYPVLWLAKPVTFASGGVFASDITSETVFERMIVDGGITLEAGSSVSGTVLGGFVPSATAVIPIIQGNDGVTGTFTGLQEGSPVGLASLTRKMRLTYAAGGGDHIAFYSAPVVVLRGNGFNIAKDDATPSATDHTDFGGVLTAGSNTVVRTFEVFNDGLAPLTGISAGVQLGMPVGGFGITSPADTLASGVFTTFDITFDPAANGIQTSTVTVTSDQPLDSPYSFAIQGEGTFPEIVVYDGTVLGTQLMDDTGEVDFGGVERFTTGAARLFTIRNIGTGPMSGIAVTKGATGLPAEFGLDTGSLAASLLPNTSTTFTVALTPGSLGPRGAVLEIASTDEDENPFEVNVTGTGVPPEFAAVTGEFMMPTEGMVGGGNIRRPLTGVINQAGFITFTALGEVGSGGINSTNDNMLLSDASGTLRVVARKGQLVDVSPWGTLAGAFGHFFLTEDGQSVALERIVGAATTRDQAYFASPDGVSLEIISREGDAAPSAGTFKTHTGKPAADALGRVYFSGDLTGTGITTKNDSGIYQESGGTLIEIVREGDDVSALTGDPAWLGGVAAMVAAAGNGAAFTALLQNHPTDTKQKTDTARNAVVLAGNESGLVLVARKGDTVPGTGGATMRTFSGVSRGGADSHAFLGLMNTGGGVTTANDQVLVAVNGTGSHLVAREGVTVADGVTLVKFGSFYATSGGDVIFEASGVLCRWTEGGGVEALARIGAAAPGMGGATFTNLAKLSVSEGGAIALVTNLSDTRRALWRALPGAALQSVVVSGETITIEGVLETIYTLDMDGSGAGTGGGGGGMGSAINDDGFVYATLSLGNGLHVGKVFP